MKIIELLNKAATGEISTKAKIKYENARDQHKDWESLDYYIHKESGKRRESEFIDFLNDEIEIIEEPKKLEKIDKILTIEDLIPPYGENEYKVWKNIIIQQNKINELIEEINKLKGEK